MKVLHLNLFFVLAPNSCLFLNKFEDLIVSSQMLFLMSISHIFYILYDSFCFFKNEISKEHEIRLYVRKDMGYGTHQSCGMGNENLSNLK